jgi:tellurite resistance protein/ADP-ribose pyrophosphatase YjhB (NUDIX family)
MAVRAAVGLDVRLLAKVGEQVLLVRQPGEDWHVLPGGTVSSGERVEPALSRHLVGLGAPPASEWDFVGAVEYAEETSGDHQVTMLFATTWPTGSPLPANWQGGSIVTVDVDVLVATPLRPPSVAWAARSWLTQDWPVWRGIPASPAAAGRRRLRPSVASLRAQLAQRREELRGNAFRDAAVAMCALVTAADGVIDPAEQAGLLGLAATEPVMSNFPAEELEELFDDHLDRLEADFDGGRRFALSEIAKVRSRPREAVAVIHIGEVIGRVDGEFAPSERAVVREAIAVLGLDPADFTA